MHLNKIGTTANQHWKTIPHHHNNVQLDEFIIMPNHIHGILILFDNDDSVETLHATSLRDDFDSKSDLFRSISPKRGSLSTIIRSYKSSVTRIVRKNILVDFAWQSRFYDHIIRTERDLEHLREYVLLNPLNWYSDDPENRLREDDAHA
jgi:REP element-mobilizing transposase RayT